MDSVDSSIISGFQFNSYKVDEFNFHMDKNMSLLSSMGTIDPNLWKLNISIRTPIFFEERNDYLAGVRCDIALIPDESKPDFKLLELSATISGTFASNGRFSKEDENQLVKEQMPAILLPYLRATITCFLSSAGFGSFIFPLININKMAQDTLKDTVITLVPKQSIPNVPSRVE